MDLSLKNDSIYGLFLPKKILDIQAFWRESCLADNRAAYEVPDVIPKGRRELPKTMKIEEIATAIGKTTSEFHALLPALSKLGFPSPRTSSDEFEIGQVLDWVGEHQTLVLNIMAILTEKLTAKD